MFYTIYKITNQLNGKIYIGYHSTEDLNDNYLGSGKILKRAIEKNGLENFTKEILYVFPSKEEALDKEKELVNEAFVQRDDTYNMKIGGEGGWDHTHSDPIISKKRKHAIKKAFENGKMKGWQLTDEQRSEIGQKSFLGKNHTLEARRKIGEAQKLEESVVQTRIDDFNNIEKKYGYKSKLAKKWNISHTQVNRFINQYNLN